MRETQLILVPVDGWMDGWISGWNDWLTRYKVQKHWAPVEDEKGDNKTWLRGTAGKWGHFDWITSRDGMKWDETLGRGMMMGLCPIVVVGWMTDAALCIIYEAFYLEISLLVHQTCRRRERERRQGIRFCKCNGNKLKQLLCFTTSNFSILPSSLCGIWRVTAANNLVFACSGGVVHTRQLTRGDRSSRQEAVDESFLCIYVKKKKFMNIELLRRLLFVSSNPASDGLLDRGHNNMYRLLINYSLCSEARKRIV